MESVRSEGTHDVSSSIYSSLMHQGESFGLSDLFVILNYNYVMKHTYYTVTPIIC